jgi:hypothetical protein
MNETLLEKICAWNVHFRFLFISNTGLLALLIIVFPFVDTGSESYYISIFAFVAIAVSLVGSGSVIWICRRKD